MKVPWFLIIGTIALVDTIATVGTVGILEGH